MQKHPRHIRKQMTMAGQFSAVPVRNQQLAMAENGEGLDITVQLKYPAWGRPLAFLLYLPKAKTCQLDSLGKELFEMIDDESTLEQIIDRFGDAHRLTFFESLAFVQSYLRTLMQRGIIVLRVHRKIPPSLRSVVNEVA